MSYKEYLFVFTFLFPLSLDAYFDYNNCQNENIFFLGDIGLKKIEVSSLYCNYGKTFSLDFVSNSSQKFDDIIKYNEETKTILNLSDFEKTNYLKRFKTDLDDIKNDEEIKDLIIQKIAKNYRDYENNLSISIKNYIFSSNEFEKLNEEIQKNPYKIFENTYSERLLMNGRIISRGERGADENYSKKEVYLEGCENWSCYTGPKSKTTLTENYIANFLEIDNRDEKIKTFDDGRDNLYYYPVDRIIIHHTAGGYKATKEEGMTYMKAVQKYHALTLRWSDIGYHYLIDGEGNIYEGRAGGKYVLGAHVSTHNYGSVGISLMSDGYYSESMLNSLEDLIVYLGKEYNLDLTGKTPVRNADLTAIEDGWALIAHKELDSRKPKDPEIDMDVFRKKIATRVKNENILTLKDFSDKDENKTTKNISEISKVDKTRKEEKEEEEKKENVPEKIYKAELEEIIKKEPIILDVKEVN